MRHFIPALLFLTTLFCTITAEHAAIAQPKQTPLTQKSLASMLTAARNKYRTMQFAEAESLLVRYLAAESQPPPQRDLAQHLLGKTYIKLWRVPEAERELLKLETGAVEEERKQEATFDLAIVAALKQDPTLAAKRFMAVAAQWSPADSVALRKKAVAYLRLYAMTHLPPDDLKKLIAETANPNLKAVLTMELVRRLMTDERTRNEAVATAEQFLSSPAATGEGRTQIDELKNEAIKVRNGGLKFLRVGVLAPVQLEAFDGLEEKSTGTKILEGIAFGAAEYNRKSAAGHLSLTVMHAPRDSAELLAAARQLLDRNIDLMLGPVYSTGAAAVARLCAERGVTMITPTATDPAITEGNKTSFQLNPTYDMRGRAIAEYAMKESGAKSFAIFAEEGTYGAEMAEGFRAEVLSQGGEVKLYGKLPPKFTSLRAAVAPLKLKADKKKGFPETKFDAIYLPLTSKEAIGIAMSQVSFFNIKGQLYGSGDWHDAATLNRFKETAEGVVYAIDSDISMSNPETESVAESLRQRQHLAPDQAFWFGYDAAAYLGAALLDRGITDRAQLAEALKIAAAVRTNHAEIFFGGGNVNRRMNIMKYSNGAITRVK
ncbi:MAG: amino acid ABC transporter substrate-binding protein [Rhizobacter sp.]|nr:amino acid ABC transporter substrate-binding protein [Chlorobiales bacterium]